MPTLLIPLLLAACGPDLGHFEGATDIGDVRHPGEARYDGSTYRVTGSGANMWDTTDAFHYAWRRAAGDLVLTADVGWEGEGQNPHRKAGWMVRGSLADDAPYADAVVHGDGLIALQYRQEPGGLTREVQSPYPAPAALRLERHGDLFTLSVAREDGSFQPVGTVTVPLGDSVYVGLAVTSHEADAQETARFENVGFEALGVVDDEERVVESTLEIINIETGERRIVRRAREHFEAPNWSLDGSTLLYNSEGRLYTIPVEGGTPTLLDTGAATNCNNDHGYSPDGSMIALSHSPEGQGSLIYVVPSTGGEPRLVTDMAPSYWHGWSPDGETLAYCARRDGEYDIYTIPVGGGPERRLTDATGLDDGPDYSPDGRYIYFNSVRTGRMAIWRMRTDGSAQEQLTTDEEYGDWFPHPSPDGRWIAFVSYDSSVEGHPPNKNVVLRLMPADGGEARVLATLFGGQGTLNVPSWSPDSKEFAFVSYRLVEAGEGTGAEDEQM
jgi:TolB protein